MQSGAYLRDAQCHRERSAKKIYANLPPREAFFFLAAHRFFMASDKRFLPSGVSWRPLPGDGAERLVMGDDIWTVEVESVSSKAAMALFSRSRSCFSSFTIAWISKGASLVNLLMCKRKSE